MGELFIGIPLGAKKGFKDTTGIESTVFNSGYPSKKTSGVKNKLKGKRGG